jgi:hypothetical protein
MDETGLSTNAKSRRVLAKKGARNVVKRTSADRGENVTLCGIVCASGNAVPACLVFLKVRFMPSMLFGAPARTLGLANRTGWMNSSLFLDVLKHFEQHVHCNPDNKVLLGVDNHESLVSLDAIDFFRANGIVMVTLPPHCTHKMQPLDKTVFHSLKTALRDKCSQFLRSHSGHRYHNL